MKHELFALESASVILNDACVFSDFSMHIHEGEILGVICDNMTEQQSLLSLFSGDCRIDGVTRFEHRIPARNALRQLFGQSFAIIGGEDSLISSLSVAENICMFSRHEFFVHSQNYRNRSLLLMEEYGISLDPDRPVSGLNAREKLLTSLMKAASEKRKIIVLYNISERVSAGGFVPVQALIRKMAGRGFSFVIIDSIDTDIFSGTDKVMIIRQCTSVACFDSVFFDRKNFWNYMFSASGTAREELPGTDSYEEGDESMDAPVISLRHVTTDLLKDISFSAARGELLKILCLDRRTIHGFRHLVSGTSSVLSGEAEINGSVLRKARHFRNPLRHGVCWCPEAPYANSVISTMSARDNMLLPLAGKVRAIWSRKSHITHIDRLLEEIGIDRPQDRASVFPPETLQKLVYSRFLIAAPSVLFIEKPFAEIDMHIRETTIGMIKTLLARGITVILLMTSPSTLSLLDGDEIFARGGRIISEEEMYRVFYEPVE